MADPEIKMPTIRRVGVDHYTEHDFEMERIGREQAAATHAERVAILESHGWEPFRGPYYFAGREWHGGHRHPDRDNRRVPTKVALAMLLADHPEVELPAWKPHPHGWTPPTSDAELVHHELVSIEPMKMPAGGLFTVDYEYGTPEEARARRERQGRLDATFKSLPGVRSYGWGTRYPGARDYIHVTVEAEEHRAAIPETWDDAPVEVTVKSEADERAEREARRKAGDEKRREEAQWLAKADRI